MSSQRDGVQVRRGSRVGGVALGEQGAPHSFEVSDARGKRRVRARWVVDAAGRTGLLARHQGLRFFGWLHYMDVHDPYTPPEATRPAPPPDLPKPLARGWVSALTSGGLTPEGVAGASALIFSSSGLAAEGVGERSSA